MKKWIIIGNKELCQNHSSHIAEIIESTEDPIYYDVDSLLRWNKQTNLKNISEIYTATRNNLIEGILFIVLNREVTAVSLALRDIRTKAYYLPEYLDRSHNNLKELKNALVFVNLNKPRLNYFEVHLTDNCNLNCKGCLHFCNIEKGITLINYDNYLSDLLRMKELFWGVETIKLLGGEPLLNKDLWKFVEITRRVFPDSYLRILTNGLLLPKIDGKLTATMNKLYVDFDISMYKPTTLEEDQIISKLNEAGVKHNYKSNKSIKYFYKQLMINPVNNRLRSYKNCLDAKNGHTLRDGTLSLCPLAPLIYKLNNKYGLNYPTNNTNNIYEDIDGWELLERLNKPIDLCCYCSPHPKFFKWEQGGQKLAKLEDWIIPKSDLKWLEFQPQYLLIRIEGQIRDILWGLLKFQYIYRCAKIIYKHIFPIQGNLIN